MLPRILDSAGRSYGGTDTGLHITHAQHDVMLVIDHSRRVQTFPSRWLEILAHFFLPKYFAAPSWGLNLQAILSSVNKSINVF